LAKCKKKARKFQIIIFSLKYLGLQNNVSSTPKPEREVLAIAQESHKTATFICRQRDGEFSFWHRNLAEPIQTLNKLSLGS
jgi:hypothetical protein